jgi:hypothetical protein
MSVISIDQARPPNFWQRLAEALDAYFVNRTKRAVPEAALRRSKHEVARCRRLMHRGVAAQGCGARR